MKIYQAYMDVEQRAFVCDGAIPFDASANCAPGTREYELFKQLHADPANRDGNEPWGLVSWKFEHKAPVGFRDFHAFCRSAFEAGADCAFINPMIGNEAVYANGWEQGIHCAHTGIEKIAYFLEQNMGIQVATVCDTSTFAFCNYFVANRRFWDAYFAFIDRALALLDAAAEAGTEVGQIYSGSGQYERDASAAMRIFVIERLFSAFLLQQDTFRVCAWTPGADRLRPQVRRAPGSAAVEPVPAQAARRRDGRPGDLQGMGQAALGTAGGLAYQYRLEPGRPVCHAVDARVPGIPDILRDPVQ